MNLPNLLTALRIALIPVLIGTYGRVPPAVSLTIFLVASLTDCLDGYLARKWNQITAFGKLFDPVADKLLLLSVLFCFAKSRLVPWWVLILMAAKELLMMSGSLYMLRRNVVVSSNYLGKAATVSFILALTFVFPWPKEPWLTATGNVLLYVAVALSVAALFVYAYGAFLKPKQQKQEG
jgi:CDP-diacylglycerol--glycerol-3-phosphate 3-phosphatidyltransferase